MNCRHSRYHLDGHCAEMSCPNYVNRCPRHSQAGRRDATCTREPYTIRERLLDIATKYGQYAGEGRQMPAFDEIVAGAAAITGEDQEFADILATMIEEVAWDETRR